MPGAADVEGELALGLARLEHVVHRAGRDHRAIELDRIERAGVAARVGAVTFVVIGSSAIAFVVPVSLVVLRHIQPIIVAVAATAQPANTRLTRVARQRSRPV